MTHIGTRIARTITPRRALLILVAWLILAVFFRDIDYDEGQYVGATALMRIGLPFRDFFYLQTPLQPLLLAPLAWLVEQHLFLALRLANAAMVGLSAVIVYHAVVGQGARRTSALAAAGLMVVCEPMIFIGAVARNDAMPLLFETMGIAILMTGWRSQRAVWLFGLAGLCFGAAISAKLHFAVPGLFAGLTLLWHWRSLGAARVAAFAVGGFTGLIPSVFIWSLAPDAFMFGVLEYGFKAPWQWYHLGNRAEMFTLPVLIGRFLLYTAVGPTIVALIAVIAARIANPRQGGIVLLLDVLIVAGLIASLLPQPIYRQYLAPLYPPLFIRLGLIVHWWPRGRMVGFLFAFMSVAALIETLLENGGHITTNLLAGRSPVMIATRDAHWLGRTVGGPDRVVAALSPELAVDSGLTFDPRFATGPFIFRTRGLVEADEAVRWKVVPSEMMDTLFATNPPDLIVTGGNRRIDVAAPNGLDVEIDRWALANRWRAIRSPSGKLIVYLQP